MLRKEGLKHNQFLNLFNLADTHKLQPILKWAGGKEKELKYILPNIPKNFNDYYEPFVGGGAVYTAIKANRYFINDKSEELISLYRLISNNDSEFYIIIEEIIHNWTILSKVTLKHSDFFLKIYKEFSRELISDDQLINYLFEFILKFSADFNGMFSAIFNFNIEHFISEIKKNLVRKIHRMRDIEHYKNELSDRDILDNIETAFKSAFYMHFRYIYNNIVKYNISDSFRIAIFLFIRNYAYSGMFRYNSHGGFNVPYGGIGYNRKSLGKKINYFKSTELRHHLEKTKIDCLDFEAFFKKNKPKKNDFIFLDPPYDSEFSTYAQNSFTRNDQQRLADYLINGCKANWMMIIKHTDYIYDLYANKNLCITSFDKKYLVSFMNRNDKNAEHLIITNYQHQQFQRVI